MHRSSEMSQQRRESGFAFSSYRPLRRRRLSEEFPTLTIPTTITGRIGPEELFAVGRSHESRPSLKSSVLSPALLDPNGDYHRMDWTTFGNSERLRPPMLLLPLFRNLIPATLHSLLALRENFQCHCKTIAILFSI